MEVVHVTVLQGIDLTFPTTFPFDLLIEADVTHAGTTLFTAGPTLLPDPLPVEGTAFIRLEVDLEFGGLAPGDTAVFRGSTVIMPELVSDLTNDGFVDADDLFVLLANWDQVGLPGDLFDSPTKPGINSIDLFVLLGEWTGPDPDPPTVAALGFEAVPEPSSLVLALLATLGLSFYRRRRQRAF